MARTSRVSSGSTSRVPLGIGWIIGLPFKRTGAPRAVEGYISSKWGCSRRACVRVRASACAGARTRGPMHVALMHVALCTQALCVHRLRGDSLDARAQLAQAFVDALIA